jgi:8-oxo-dGTP pyrophosphatase MutT (NUDIX family)
MITFAETLDRLRSRLPQPLIHTALTSNSVESEPVPDAAVAVILRECDNSIEMLIIQRAENPGDYWSGHLALPGGRVDPADPSLLATAAREVAEEVGIDLSLTDDFVGQLTPLSPSSKRLPLIRVTPFVAALQQPATLRLSHEVGAAFWASVDELRRSGLSDSKSFMLGDKVHEWPAYPSEKGPIWGLTQRIISEFLTYLE